MPRKDTVDRFLLAREHDCLQAHLKITGVAESDTCILCDSGIMDGSYLDP